MQFVLSWVNPYAPLAPVFDTIVRPFLRPIRRFIPPIANIDLSPAILFIIVQVVLLRWARCAWPSAHTLILDLHVQPGAKRSEFAGRHGERIKLRLLRRRSRARPTRR